MSISQFITFISWSFAASLLLIFTIVAAIVYQDNRQKVFKFYALYCFLLLLYCLTKIPDFFYSFSQVRPWKGQAVYQSFYWLIQVLFHNAYLTFGIYFLSLKEIAPKLTRGIFKYQKVIILTFGLLAMLVIFGQLDKQMLVWGFSYVFIEVHLAVCFLIIFAVRKTHYFLRNYFVVGSLLYMIMILVSFALTALNISLGPISPPAIFYAAITVESCIFSAGLGIQIRTIYRKKMKFQKDLNSAQLKVQAQMNLELDKKELEVQNNSLNAQVLRSQMNSHFIFNVLNSIKFFVRETETEKALLYLGRFARFIRRVLDGSIYEHNTLKDELETLELYLSIEKMRFNDELEYYIDVQEDLDLSSIPFPALLLQPLVENALWHGLHPKTGDKKIEIEVDGSENQISIIIRDNGIGHSAAARQKTSNERNSQGLKIVEKRITFYNNTNRTKLRSEVVHLIEGTEVKISLLLKRSQKLKELDEDIRD